MRTTWHSGLILLSATVLLAACGKQGSGASSASGEWLSYGLNGSETRQSPLTDITPATVADLKPAWFADLTDISTRAFEATPLVVDNTMFVSTGWSNALAFDAKTGKQLWRYDPVIAKDYTGKGCCGPVSRGLAYAGGKVFLGAFDGRLIALDAKAGKPVWTTLTVDQSKDYTITGAPRVVGDNVIIGNGGAELGVRGYVSAYNVRTGKLAWRFYTVPPKPGTKDGAASDAILAKITSSWSGDWWQPGGGGTVWDSMAYDPDLDLLYIGVGNGGPWNHQMRSAGKGDNLFVSSIVALRPSTGEYVWHFQATPGDEWDFTSTQSIILTDLTIDGKPRKVLMQAPKNGFYYVLDRQTGEFLSGTPYVKVTWAKGLDPKTGRPIESGTNRYSETGKPSFQQPGPLGGHNWQPMSYSAKTGLAYIPASQNAYNYVAADRSYKVLQGAPNMGIDPVKTALPDDPRSLDGARASLSGELIAWDPVKKKAAWRVVHPMAWNGGTLVTDGGLVFQGTASGDLVAYDAATGDKKWSMNLGAGIVAAPMTYKVGGEQYVAIAVGWGGGLSQVAGAMTRDAKSTGINRLVVLKLNGTAQLPAVAPAPARTLDPPPPTGTPAMVAAGQAIYERRCFICHGTAAISGGEVPDLRYSGALGSAEAFDAIVRQGALSTNGMPNFGRDLSATDVQSLRAYLIARANKDRAQQTSSKGE